MPETVEGRDEEEYGATVQPLRRASPSGVRPDAETATASSAYSLPLLRPPPENVSSESVLWRFVMKSLFKILSAVGVCLGLLSASAWAAKPGLSDCPCFLSDPGLYYTLLDTTCVDVAWLNRTHTIGLQVPYLRVHWKEEEEGAPCNEFIVSRRGNCCWMILMHFTEAPVARCVDPTTFIAEDLTDEQTKACAFAAMEAMDYLEALPPCD